MNFTSAGPNSHRGSMLRWMVLAFVLATIANLPQVNALPRPVVQHNGIHVRHMPHMLARRDSSKSETSPAIESVSKELSDVVSAHVSGSSSDQKWTVQKIQKKIQEELSLIHI